ncbi:hypothetical protein [Sporosarcina jiandibaonis]|uniref:hypothetical protein n=1 Tax=Sporosarcina jiandibaonis TaxID=2715535 RepID=UPI00155722DA|nr:hypothetical protein [Sporosarcina jiandibaonis]
MTTIGITAVLIIGLLILAIGFVTKKRWLMILSVVPLAISIFQLVMLAGMGK